jgi:hypothetical protein
MAVGTSAVCLHYSDNKQKRLAALQLAQIPTALLQRLSTTGNCCSSKHSSIQAKHLHNQCDASAAAVCY